MEELTEKYDTMTDDELAQALARSLEKRALLLELLSMNLYDMEENSWMERLAEFKVAYGNSIRAVARLLEKFRPQMEATDRQQFLYTLFPFIYGVYPYTVVMGKQRVAMEAAGTDFVYLSVYEMIYTGAKRLLTGGKPDFVSNWRFRYVIHQIRQFRIVCFSHLPGLYGLWRQRERPAPLDR